MTRKSGYSLVETVVSLVVSGIILLIAMPRMRDLLLRSDVRSARSALVRLHAQARAAAAESGRTTRLRIDGNRVVVLASPRRRACAGTCTADTIGAVHDFDETYGVALTSTVDSLMIDPRGLNRGPEAVVRVGNSAMLDSMQVTSFGRVVR